MTGGDPERASHPVDTADPAGPAVVVSDRLARPLDQAQLHELTVLATRALAAEGVTEGELSLSFVEPEEIEELHVRYMDEPGPTDVLSFPMGEDGLLGDVIVCPAVAATNNPIDTAAELRLLVVHGVLHVLGYDHQDPEERAEMWARQERYSGVRAP